MKKITLPRETIFHLVDFLIALDMNNQSDKAKDLHEKLWDICEEKAGAIKRRQEWQRGDNGRA